MYCIRILDVCVRILYSDVYYGRTCVYVPVLNMYCIQTCIVFEYLHVLYSNVYCMYRFLMCVVFEHVLCSNVY